MPSPQTSASRPRGPLVQPRLPNRPLLIVSGLLLAGWTVILVLIALRVI